VSQQPIRILVADDHLVVRLGLITLINNQPDMRVVGDAANGQDLIGLFRQHKPDIILMDLRMPGLSGDETIATICEEDPKVGVIVITIHKGDEAAFQALRAGARGYLIKDVLSDEITDAIRRVHGGGQCIPPSVAEQLAGRLAKAALSSREIDVLKLIAEGLSTKEVATRLGVADTTAKKHTAGVLSKLGAKDRTHAVRLALERGIITLET
jgi:two-component system NarL family response regulator